jgi:hypothetical protein
MKVFRSPIPLPEVPEKAVQDELARRVPDKYWDYERFVTGKSRVGGSGVKSTLETLSETVQVRRARERRERERRERERRERERSEHAPAGRLGRVFPRQKRAASGL